MKLRTPILAAFLLLSIPVVAQYTPATVPNTKLINNSYVSNPDLILSEYTVEQINSILASVEERTTAQVAVVVLQSIGDADEFEFAQELFTLWGIGRSNDNGLLMLLVIDKPVIRFHTGYGLEGPLPDAVCKQIQRNVMIPAFKQGDYDGGMLAGVQEVEKILTDPNYSIEITDTGTTSDAEVSGYTAFVIFFLAFGGATFLIVWAAKSGRFANSKQPIQTDYQAMRMTRRKWMMLFGGIPLLIVIAFWFAPAELQYLGALFVYLYYMSTIFYRLVRERKMINRFIEKRKYFEITEYLRRSQGYWIVMAIIFPIPFIGYFPFHFARKRFYRNHPRNCKLCDKEMIKLTELQEDEYLTMAQQIEETIRSVDYDIWKCTGCAATEGWAFKNRFSKYKECPACKSIGYYLHSDKTLVSPTYSSSGKGEEIRKCKVCGNTARKTYSIAKLERSSSSGSSSGGGSSSSSGGSWGGGRSGGGGASSSW